MEPTRNLTLFLHHSRSIYHIITDLKGQYIYINELYRKIFFSANGHFQTHFFQHSVVPEDAELFREAREECLRVPGTTVCSDLRRSREDGSLFWIRWEFTAIVENEQVTGLEALGTDASERKRAELEKAEVQENLFKERYLLRTLIDHLPDYIYVKDTESRHLLTNQAHLDMIGAETEEDVLGKTVLDYFDESSATEQIKKDEQLFRSGKPMSNMEEYVINKKGEKKWLLTTRVPLQEDDNTVIGLVGISRDITERKKTEESLRVSIERFNILSKATNDAIWDWDLVTDKILWNDAVTLLFGFTRDQIARDQKFWENTIHPDDKQRVLNKTNRHIDRGIENWQDEYRFMCSDGSFKLVYDRGYILFDSDHKPYRMIGAMMDITERKKLQDELASSTIARQMQITEATMLAQEKERAEIGRELHDNINQILTTTKMYLDIALTEKDISEELMIKSHENISTAIEEIRILSKSLVPPSLGDIGLKAAISEMINNLNISQKINIRLKTTGLSKFGIPGNVQLMIYRIVQEQMNNVQKHSGASEAEIRLSAVQNELTVTITDNGVGFDPKKRGKGIGFMNITSRVEVHKGKVQIISKPGKGCSLIISIPF